MPGETDDNGRLLARLDERMKSVQNTADEIKLMLIAFDTRLRSSENEISLIKGRWSLLLVVISAVISLAIGLYLK